MAVKVGETQISKGISEYLNALGHVCIRSNSGTIIDKKGYRMTLAPKGWPDLTVYMTNGETAFIEVKAGKNKASDEQLAWHEKLRGLGFRVLVAWSVQEVVDWLEGAGQCVQKS